MVAVLLLFLVLTAYSLSSKTDNKENFPAVKISTKIPKQNLKSQSIKQVYPSEIIDLTNWKLTLPIGQSENPTEIQQPELASFIFDPWFIVAPVGSGVRFRAAVNGVTTKNSDYPRSELREMTNNGMTRAAWLSKSGTHTMFIDQAITAVPKKKKHIIAGQIHDKNDDVIVVRLDHPKLHIKVGDKIVRTLDSDYVLGERFTVKFVVKGNKTSIYYNGNQNSAYTLNKEYSSAYFKAGAYTQSNCQREGSSLCADNNYGEVIIYKVEVTHQ